MNLIIKNGKIKHYYFFLSDWVKEQFFSLEYYLKIIKYSWQRSFHIFETLKKKKEGKKHTVHT